MADAEPLRDKLTSGHEPSPAVDLDPARPIPVGLVDTSALWVPDHFGDVAAWTEHAPFAFWAVGALEPRTFVELGTHAGYSYFAVCQAVQQRNIGTRCYAVDTWQGDEHAGFYGEEVYEQVSAHETEHFSAFSTLVRATFDDAVSRFPDGSIDLLHIDGRHFYADVKHDFETWSPKLSDRAVVMFHDTNEHQRGFGVHLLWQELRQQYPSFEFLHGHGLGVLGYGTAVPAAFAQLLALTETDPETAAVRAVYARLGAALTDRMVRLRQEVQLASAAEVAAAATTRAADLERALTSVRSERDLAVAALADAEASNSELAADLRAGAQVQAQAADLFLAVSTKRLGKIARRWDAAVRDHPRATGLAIRPSTAIWRMSTLRWPMFLRASPLFDPAWYRQRYPDVPSTNARAWRHYWRHGRHEARDPNDFFDGMWYMDQNPDVRASGTDPLSHYLRHGGFEGRDPSTRFRSAWYLRHNPDVLAAGINPLLHYLRHGRGEGREPGPPAQFSFDGGSSSGADAESDPLAESVPDRSPPESLRRSRIDRAWTYYRRNGFWSLVRRMADEAGHRARPGFPPPDARVPWVNTNAHNIVAQIDTPAGHAAINTPDFTLTGWALAATGISAIDVYVDTTPTAQLLTDIDRPDVARVHANLAAGARCGFSAQVNIEGFAPGRHTLTIAVHDHAGSTRVLAVPLVMASTQSSYHGYFTRMLPSTAEMMAERDVAASRGPLPTFEIIVHSIESGGLDRTLRSIAHQGYPDWHCTVVAQPQAVQQTWEHLPAMPDTGDQRFAVSDSASQPWMGPVVHGRWFGWLSAGEVLSPHALECFAYASVVTTTTSVVYSDHDTILTSGRHEHPSFKPDWSPDHLLSRDYVGGVFMARDGTRLREILREDHAFDGRAWRYDLLLRLTDEDDAVAHVPRVLWSAPVPTDRFDIEVSDGELEVVATALERRATGATVATVADSGIRRVTWPLATAPLVSIVVPTTGRMDLVEPLLTSLTTLTAYHPYELAFLDNGRGAHRDGIELLRSGGHLVIERDEPFNWARLNNVGARATSGELLLFLNDDIQVTDPGWLGELVRLAIRPDVGTVGSLLTFPDGRIQHAGVVIVGHGGGAMHVLHKLVPGSGLYLDLDRVTRETTASTGACLMVSREHFDLVGGFDEDLEVVGNDIDLCLRISALGHRNLWTPFSTLTHHESVSRRSISIIDDETRMWQRWSAVLRAGDPYFNPNLAQDRPDCAVDLSRMLRRPAQTVDPTAGVNLIGYIRAEMGVGEAMRGEAQAMIETDVPFVTIDYGRGNPARMGDHTFVHTVVPRPVYDVNLIYINADVLGDAAAALPADLRRGRYTIGQWAWEMPEFPDRWTSSFDLVDEVWCPSEFVRSALAAKSPVPVVRMPHAVRAPSGPFVDRGHFGLRDQAYQFLMMYDVNSVQERKNPSGAVTAFARAFQPDDDSVVLIVKVNNADKYERRQIRDMVGGRPNITVIDTVLDRYEVDSLFRCSDAFVSLHRSEGFGLTMAEAMRLGKPVIATHWSGNVDFMNAENAGCVQYSLVTLTRDYGPYAAGQQWADPDLDHAAWWMRRVRGDPILGKELGMRARATILQDFSPLAVGLMTSRRLAEIRAGRQA